MKTAPHSHLHITKLARREMRTFAYVALDFLSIEYANVDLIFVNVHTTEKACEYGA